MKDQIKNILFNRYQVTSGNVLEWLSQNSVTQEELEGVMGKSIVADLLRTSEASTIASGGVYKAPAQNNLIVFWGVPGSGKTSVIASLLSLDGVRPILPTGYEWTDIDLRFHELIGIFKNKDTYQQLPTVEAAPVETYHAVYKKNCRKYNLSFIEARPNCWEYANNLLKANEKQIHIFCLDCSQDISSQVAEYNEVLGLLTANGYLNNAAGVYVLVTKSDQLNAPEPYLDNAAQTLITASHASSLWRHIRNACKKTYIFNEQPIIYSNGDYALKDFAKLSSVHAQRLFDEFIIPKCEHKHWGLVRLLKMGSRTMAYTVIAFLIPFLGLTGYGLFQVMHNDESPCLSPYDYKTHFIQSVEQQLSANANYDDASEAYETLRSDLNVETALLQNEGGKVLAEADAKECDSKLTNAFSVILSLKLETQFHSNWTQDQELLKKTRSQLQDLKSHSEQLESMSINEINKYLSYYDTYDDIKTFINSSCHKCTNVDDVRNAESRVSEWNKYPFDSDTELTRKLKTALLDACYSSGNYYLWFKHVIHSESFSNLMDELWDLVDIYETIIEDVDPDDEKYYEQLHELQGLRYEV